MATTNLGKVSVTPKGEYDPLITYERLDIISHNGSSYIVKQASTGVTPIEGEFYALIAEKGDGGSFVKKAYKTYTAMDADKVNIPANSSVDVTNDPDESKNGAYIYDGAAFTRSQYDSKVVTDKIIADTAIAVQDAINNTVISSGFITIDSFELGATLTQRNQALRHAADDKLYRWAGDLPKIVPTSSSPLTAGGFGSNGWLEVGDTVLRTQLTQMNGSALINSNTMSIANMSALLSLSNDALRADLTYLTQSYHIGGSTGGASYKWDANTPKTNHNGITIIDSTKTLPNFNNPTEVEAWLSSVNTGAGCFVLIKTSEIDIRCTGLKGGLDDESVLINQAVNVLSGNKILWAKAENDDVYRFENIFIPKNTDIVFGAGFKAESPTQRLTTSKLSRFFEIRETENVNLVGTNALFKMANPLYTGEYSHGFNVISSSNFSIKGIRLEDVRGDAIYVGGAVSCENFTIDKVVTERAFRQGLAVTHGRYGTITNSHFNNAAGINPQGGLDLEANAGQVVEYITVENCHASGNLQNGLIAPVAQNCVFIDCTATDNGGTGFGSATASNNIRFIRCTATNNGETGFNMDGDYTIAENCKAVNNTGGGFRSLVGTGTEVISSKANNNGFRGISIDTSNSKVVGNSAIGNLGVGVYIAANYSELRDNTAIDNTGKNIYIFSGHDLAIINNIAKNPSGLAEYGMQVRDSTSITNAFISGNNLRDSGTVAGLACHPTARGVIGKNIMKDGTYTDIPN